MAVKNMNRRNAILAMKQQGATLEKIGKEFGISRERIRQIIKGPDTSKRVCAFCGEEYVKVIGASGSKYHTPECARASDARRRKEALKKRTARLKAEKTPGYHGKLRYKMTGEVFRGWKVLEQGAKCACECVKCKTKSVFFANSLRAENVRRCVCTKVKK